MTSLAFTILEINLLIVILFGAYACIKQRVSFNQQRWLLLGIPFIATIVVTLKSAFSSVSYGIAIPLITLNPVQVGQNNAVSNDITSAVSVADVAYLTYIIVAICLGVYAIYKIGKLGWFFSRHTADLKDGFYIYTVKGEASFSFFNRIQITPELTEVDQGIVLEHEKMHAAKLHSLDTLILEFIHVVFWFNPVLIFMKKELTNLHEFEVDTIMFNKHRVNYMKFLVNYALGATDSNYLLISRFYNRLTIKKRIKIMKTNKTTKSKLLFIIPLIALGFGFVQCQKTDSNAETKKEKMEVFDKVDVEPEFNGGQEAMVKYIQNEVKYPKNAANEGVEGTIYVGFVVSKYGEITEANVMRPVHPELDAEALRVVRLMPDWKPGMKDGKDVAVRYTLPISFQLN